MEEGTKSKKTVFVGGIGDDVDESVIYERFATFGWSIRTTSQSSLILYPGDVIEVQLPSAATIPHQQSG